MQKKYIGFVAGLLLLAGCSDNDQVFNQVDESVGSNTKVKSFTSFTASIDGTAETRACIVDGKTDGNKSLAWNDDLDEWIHVFSDADQAGVSTDYKLQSVKDNVGTFIGNAVSGDTFFAVYANQWWERDAENPNLLQFHVGEYYEHPNTLNGFQFFGPMLAVSETNSFQFKQLTGLIHVSVSGIHKLKEVSLLAVGQETIAGLFTLDLREPTKLIPVEGTYSSVDGVWFGNDGMQLGNDAIDIYFPIAPTTFKQGFSMFIEGEDLNGDDVKLTKTYSKQLTVGRAEVKHFNLVDIEGEVEPVDKTEREILMDLYNATDGAHWTNNTNWGSDKPLDEWYGISLSYDGSVFSISLSNNNLNGYIPRSIGGLRDLRSFSVPNNKLSGKIPAELSKLTELRSLNLSSNTDLSGSLPENIGDLTHLYYLGLYQCSKIGGEIPESFYTLKELEVISIAFCSFSGSFSENFGNLESLVDIRMCGNKMSGPIPESVGNLKKLKVFMIRWNNLTGDLPASMGNMTSLESIYLEGNQLTGCIPDSFMNLSNLTWMNISGNCMSGTISEEMYKSDWWNHVQTSIAQRDGYGLTIEGVYTSTDFSKDGSVREIQSHSKGNGIKLVITGDGFSDRLIADGTFDSYVDRAVKFFFDKEPYTTFRDYFDVYGITSVSKNDVIGAETSFGVKASGDKYIFNVDDVANFVSRSLKSSVGNVTVLVIVNDAVSGGRVFCQMYSDGFSVGLCTVSDEMGQEINHEIGGHGFGHLADEYWNDDHSNSTFQQSAWANLDKMHSIGWYQNVDYHSDPLEVLWADFISNPAYAVEGIGVYEGGYANFTYGIYRPTENSIMRDNVGQYNAPSRWAIYQRMMELAGESYSFTSFLDYDQKNLAANTRNYVERSAVNRIKHGAPPVFYNYPSSTLFSRKTEN